MNLQKYGFPIISADVHDVNLTVMGITMTSLPSPLVVTPTNLSPASRWLISLVFKALDARLFIIFLLPACPVLILLVPNLPALPCPGKPACLPFPTARLCFWIACCQTHLLLTSKMCPPPGKTTCFPPPTTRLPSPQPLPALCVPVCSTSMSTHSQDGASGLTLACSRIQASATSELTSCFHLPFSSFSIKLCS